MNSSAWFALSVLVGVCLGVVSARFLISDSNALIVRSSGPWQFVPQAGAPGADPYSRARFLLRNELPEHFSEVLTFFATTDSTGSTLSADCTYRISLQRPRLRRWSLSVANEDGTSASIITQDNAVSVNGEVTARLSSRPQPGHWLRPADTGDARLVLRLYNSDPIAAGGSALPAIVREDCE